MNESPDTDDDRSIRRLLEESGTGESPELLEGLRLLRSFRALPAPAPTGDLAAMLTEPPAQPRRRSQRHRGLILSFALAGAMGAGTTGVAANNDLRLATESFCADVIEQVLPQDASWEPAPPADVPPVEPLSAGGSSPEGEAPPPEAEAPAMVDAAPEPDAGFSATAEDPAAQPAPPTGETAGEHEVSAGVEAPPPVEEPFPAPHAEPQAGNPDHGQPTTARPGRDRAVDGTGPTGHRSDNGPGTANSGQHHSGGPNSNGRNSSHAPSSQQNSSHAPSGPSGVRGGDEHKPIPAAEAPGVEPAAGMGGM